MRPNRVVLPSPHLDQYLHLLERVNDSTIQKLIAELPVEALRVAVLPWATRLDVKRSCPHVLQPLPPGNRRELKSVVRPDVPRHSPEHKQLRTFRNDSRDRRYPRREAPRRLAVSTDGVALFSAGQVLCRPCALLHRGAHGHVRCTYDGWKSLEVSLGCFFQGQPVQG